MNDIHLAKLYLRRAQNAKDKGVKFQLSLISFKNLMQAKRCHYTGVALTEPNGKTPRPTDRTFDRVDNRYGYVKGNVVACSHMANHIKSLWEAHRSNVGDEYGARMFESFGKVIRREMKETVS